MARMFWTDWRGKEVSRVVNETIDLRQLEGTPGYALLFIAANPHLSRADILRWLQHIKGVGRSDSWIQKRRWLFQKPGASNAPGVKVDMDGQRKRALSIMRENSRLSSRALAALLAEHGIKRGREWVRKNRCCDR